MFQWAWNCLLQIQQRSFWSRQTRFLSPKFCWHVISLFMNLSENFSLLCLFAFLAFTSAHASGSNNVSFYRNYFVTWGHDHVLLGNQETEIQLSLDQNSGCVRPALWIPSFSLWHPSTNSQTYLHHVCVRTDVYLYLHARMNAYLYNIILESSTMVS